MTPEQFEIIELKNRLAGLEAELNSYKSAKLKLSNSNLSTGVLAHLVDAIGDFVIITNEEGLIQYTNRAVTTRFGYDEQELIGQPSKILLEPQSGDHDIFEIRAQTRHIRHGRRHQQYYQKRRDFRGKPQNLVLYQQKRP
ncbi:MAG: PAS domain-containing protein [Lentimicrobium sp.]|nr:PAS domain-containing protein [Lentimicrobium sp.]